MWNRSSLSLLIGSSLAGFGGWIDFLAILTLSAYVYNADAYFMALISAAFLVPSMLLGQRVGKLIDRSRPEYILLVSLSLRCVATALLLLNPSQVIFFVLVLLRSIFTVPTDPAGNVLVSRCVSKSDVPRYFGMLGLLRNVSKIAAPTIGAVIASQFGEARSVYLSILITLAAMAFLLYFGLQAAPSTAQSQADSSTSRSTGTKAPEPASDGLEPGLVMLSKQLLWTMAIFSFMVFFINNQLPVLLRNAGFDKALLGVLVSCSGAGGILTAAYMSRRSAAGVSTAPMTSTTVAVLATATCFVGLGVAFTLPASIAPYVAGALFFCTGVFASIVAIRSNTVVVQYFPKKVGQISATMQAYQSAAMLIAPWLAAVIIPLVSMPILFILDGVLALLILSMATLWFRNATSPRGDVAPVSRQSVP